MLHRAHWIWRSNKNRRRAKLGQLCIKICNIRIEGTVGHQPNTQRKIIAPMIWKHRQRQHQHLGLLSPMWGGSDAFLSQQLCRLVGPGSCWWNLRFMGWFLYSQSWIMDMKTPMFGNQKKVFFLVLVMCSSLPWTHADNLGTPTWYQQRDSMRVIYLNVPTIPSWLVPMIPPVSQVDPDPSLEGPPLPNVFPLIWGNLDWIGNFADWFLRWFV